MKKIAFFVAAALISGQAYAAVPSGDDVTTKPDQYYSTNAEGLDSLAILPPPPAFDSIEFLIDRARYEEGLIERDTERGKLAVLDAKSGKVAESLSPAFGIDINEKNTPEIYRLVCHLRGELGDMATRSAKQKYYRTRPYVLYNTKTCYPDDEERLRHNGSYPSGHSARGWAVALILAEINPDRKEVIMQRGFDMGQSRVICGYHWQSDVDAGRLAGSVAVSALHANPEFMKQLEKAKAEFAALKKAGKIK